MLLGLLLLLQLAELVAECLVLVLLLVELRREAAHLLLQHQDARQHCTPAKRAIAPKRKEGEERGEGMPGVKGKQDSWARDDSE